MQWLPRDGQRVVPWKNGGGSTRQVAIEPADGSLADGFVWRISVAGVAEHGPFSQLPGIDRSRWLLHGRGVDLETNGVTVRLDRILQRFDFAGEAAVSARLLDGPIEDLNVMVARDAVAVDAAVHELPEGAMWRSWLPNAEHVMVALTGTMLVFGGVLAPGDAVRFAGSTDCEAFAPQGVGAFLLASFVRRS